MSPFIPMELLKVNASTFSGSPLLYFHCLDFNSETYISSTNLACCRFLKVLGHVCFPKTLRERQLCLFLCQEKLTEIGKKTSLVVIKVKLNCIHEVTKMLDWCLEDFCIKDLSVSLFFPIWMYNWPILKRDFTHICIPWLHLIHFFSVFAVCSWKMRVKKTLATVCL